MRTAFAPTAEEVAWARKVVASGTGAVAVDGAMIDEPVRIRAGGSWPDAGRAG